MKSMIVRLTVVAAAFVGALFMLTPASQSASSVRSVQDPVQEEAFPPGFEQSHRADAVVSASERFETHKAKQLELSDPDVAAPVTAFAVERRGERYLELKARQLELADPDTSLTAAPGLSALERYYSTKARGLQVGPGDNSSESGMLNRQQRYEDMSLIQLQQVDH